jgi:nifR3 family TIM-barrel protein
MKNSEEILNHYDKKFSLLGAWYFFKKPKKHKHFSLKLLLQLIFLELFFLLSILYIVVNIFLQGNVFTDLFPYIICFLTVASTVYYQFLWNKKSIMNTTNNFWHTLSQKKKSENSFILGLSPMDGVTDAPFRKLLAQTSKPDIIMTEFVNVEGLARGAVKMLQDFEYDECERPIIAQIYGTEIDSFYKVAFIACELGFDGIDINMGCPAKKVAHRGAGAGLINTPEHAQKIIFSVQKAVQDFASGITMEEAQVRPKVIQKVREMQEKTDACRGGYHPPNNPQKKIPISVKTRMGVDDVVAEEWIQNLLETNIQAITLHGRTLKQGYSGEANWEVIKKAGEVVKKWNISQKKNNPEHQEVVFLGNGDIENYSDAQEKIAAADIDGALVGRALFGNPWFFSKKNVFDEVFERNTEEEAEKICEQIRKEKCLEHCQLFEEIFPEKPFFIMRKHLAWYMKNFSGSKELRKKLMLANSSEEVKEILRL